MLLSGVKICKIICIDLPCSVINITHYFFICTCSMNSMCIIYHCVTVFLNKYKRND